MEITAVLKNPWVATGISLALALIAVTIAYRIGETVIRRLTRHRPIATLLVDAVDEPGRLIASLLVIQAVLQAAPDDLPGMRPARHLTGLVLIGAVTWLAVRCIGTMGPAAAILYPINVKDNLEARRIQTQARVMARVLDVIVVIVGLSVGLTTFPALQKLGASLLASAGIAGIVLGFSAQKVLGNLLAGLQIALTQPFRLDDVVIIEGEWGRIEEIHNTYVVVAIWDQRRLVVPLQKLIEQPFQNWTRTSSEILGTVFLWLDFSVPIEPLRQELRRLCESSPDWDGRVCGLVVTDASDRAMQIRALVSSVDSGRGWDLRCFVRERLIAYIHEHYPGSLPRLRLEEERTAAQRTAVRAGERERSEAQ
jgi:small-conductance mechanosensitive channel